MLPDFLTIMQLHICTVCFYFIQVPFPSVAIMPIIKTYSSEFYIQGATTVTIAQGFT